MRRGQLDRFATWYLNGQAVAVALWWVGLLVSPTIRSAFVSSRFPWTALQGFFLSDAVFLVTLGFVAASRIRQTRRHGNPALVAHVAVGASSALIVGSLSLTGQGPTLAAAAMSPYLVIGPWLLWIYRR